MEVFNLQVVTGLNKRIRRNRRFDKENGSKGLVGLQKIVWKAKPYEALDATLNKNFILKHEKFVEPEFVLQVFEQHI